ncbi:hypothetical protein BUALT_Bualt15G0120000 [Buddleja alternifolia]|uniref:Growth-regulating factor n=1 Tax=Buddleja alternifolia TaxID=168488 RepID=A0AAV6WM90_9LAMI|nr:hypothetical protein BUALT_Bualt15G0120000 [Buddleja alternifolia]
MDLGMVGLDNLISSNSQASNNGGFSLENAYGSEFLKQERTINEENDNHRDFKMAKISSNEGHQQMLSFSSQTHVTLPYYNYQTSNGAFTRNTGYGSGGVMSSVRGPFTPSQWMELEHQALIYKYITANVPIPSYLLNPIAKALESACLRSNALGWGGFHLGFSNTDPEPGRCRRTDGKKWRCSRDAVADQKYCERHINRGRHRSRKPVEGQSGHSASRTTTTNVNPKPPPSSTSATGVSNGLNDLQPSGSNNHLSGIPNINRSLLHKKNAGGAYQQTTTVLSMASPNVSLKNHHNQYEESSHPEFGLVCSDSLLNPLNTNFRNYDHSQNLNNHDQIKSQHALRQFMDDWPKNLPDRSPVSWPDIDLQPDRTQLSISTPMATSNEKLATSPQQLSRELEMGLGVGTIDSQQNQRQQNNWVPISWEPSMGGPLGEVLHNTSNNTSECNNPKALNLMERWENSSRLASSPTGVLQGGAFGSFSNSSAGSSPRAESSKTPDGASVCNGLIGRGLVSPTIGSLSKF